MLSKRIEEVSLNAWPALQHMFFDGWILRFSKGYTKRANSINPLFDSRLDIAEKVVRCERLYAERGLPPVFRLTPFVLPPDLDQFLDRRQYKRIDQTHVQHFELKGQGIAVDSSVKLHDETLDDWLEIFCRLSGVPVARHQAHKEILQAIPSGRLLAVLTNSSQIVACGLGVLEHDYFGLFDLVTDSQERDKGYGAKLVFCMLRWAQEHGATHVYLQVMSSNTPARHLYAKLGFQDVYQYWYRVPDV
jgi:ribosomal protein S18 acetylase RimI-like enzyme